MDVLALLGEEVGLQALQYQAVSALDLSIREWMGYHGPIHSEVVIVTEIQQFFPGELSVVVGDNGVRDPEIENDVLDEIHHLLRANLHQRPCLNPLSKLIDRDKQVGPAPIGCDIDRYRTWCDILGIYVVKLL
jgi:hypothetical protein